MQSPERLIGVKHSFASNVWSFGLLARYLAVGQFPLPIEDPPSVLGFKSSVVDTDVSHLAIFPLGWAWNLLRFLPFCSERPRVGNCGDACLLPPAPEAEAHRSLAFSPAAARTTRCPRGYGV